MTVAVLAYVGPNNPRKVVYIGLHNMEVIPLSFILWSVNTVSFRMEINFLIRIVSNLLLCYY